MHILLFLQGTQLGDNPLMLNLDLVFKLEADLKPQLTPLPLIEKPETAAVPATLNHCSGEKLTSGHMKQHSTAAG